MGNPSLSWLEPPQMGEACPEFGGSEMVQIDQTWKKLEPYESRVLGIRIYIYICALWCVD
jgi:hypothetical protein